MTALVVALALLSQAKDGHDVFGMRQPDPPPVYPPLDQEKIPDAVKGKPDPAFERRVAERKAKAKVDAETVAKFKAALEQFKRDEAARQQVARQQVMPVPSQQSIPTITVQPGQVIEFRVSPNGITRVR